MRDVLHRRIQRAGAAVIVGLAAGCAAEALAQTSPAGDPGQRCDALAGQVGSALGDPSARIISAKFNPPSAAKSAASPFPGASGGLPAMPAHCEVMGVLRERTGANGQRYAVKFHLRLPAQWNGRFLFEGSGGTAGALSDSTGRLQPGMPDGLDQGYAVVSTDTGHDNKLNNDPTRQGQVAFGHDYMARVEYAETSLDSVATTAKRLIRAYYGGGPQRSYFVGCSNGGREGMVFAQRFPDQFDGIVAQAPAFAVPKAAIAEAWDTQTFAALAVEEGLKRPDGLPDITKTFSNADFVILSEAVAKACDASDGLVDGMVQNLGKCTISRVRPALAARTCTKGKSAECLSHNQVDTLIRALGGPHDSKGRQLYADWPWDVGVGSFGWRIWKTGVPGALDSINIMLGSPALSGLFITPPADVGPSTEAGLRYQLDFDFDRDAPKIFATTPDFPRSGWNLVGAQSTNLDRFRAHDGKMIVPHGGSDPIFSINDTERWWGAVNASTGGKASSFVRVYPVPGMNHCGGGPATDQFDALAALTAWVEQGKAPERIEAKAGGQTPWPGRTRPLCAYPSIAVYRSGDPNLSGSFACRKPPA